MAQAQPDTTEASAAAIRWLGIATAVLAGLSFAVVGAGAAGPSLTSDLISRLIGSLVAAVLLVWVIRRYQFSERRPVGRILVLVTGLVLGAAVWYGYLLESKVRTTVIGVLIAIGASALLFVGANKWIDTSRKSLPQFGAISAAVMSALISVLLIGNRLVGLQVGGRNLSFLLVLVVAAIAGAFGFLLGKTSERPTRMLVGAGGGAIVGLVVGIFFRPGGFPAMFALQLVIWPLLVAALGAGLATIRNQPWPRGAITGATIGWLLGAWLLSTIGAGTILEALLGTVVLGALAGLRYGARPLAGRQERLDFERRARATTFLAPALIFIAAALVIPTILTILLSFRDAKAEALVGLANYLTIFRDPDAIDISGWAGIFRSGFFWAALVLAVIGTLAGIVSGRRIGSRFGAHGGSVGAIALGSFLLAFAIFTNLRGTIFNNLWWVFTVTVLAAGLGLAVAVLADRAKSESLAKSIIFMPMAISFVGAALIWRFVYIARPPSKNQTGLANAFWVGIGQVSASPLGKAITLVILGLAIAGLLYLALRARRAGTNGLLAGSVMTVLPLIYVAYRFLTGTLGGITQTADGSYISEPWQFITTPRLNNFWLMVVLIWIQTGFTMVIFSAAIKSVPSELIEASRVDGATESETFWRITVPQIAPTIGVVTTTLIVLVMKVFDIVKVMTNGNFDTQVIANLMWTRGFSEFNRGLGAALAVVLFLSVLPVMFVNIRRMQKEAT